VAKGRKLFTSESVAMGHPDKCADQISDGILDEVMRQDPYGRVACETLLTTGLVLVAGEMTTTAYVDIPEVVRQTVKEIGYTDPTMGFDYQSCAVLVSIHEQSPDIAQGVLGKGLHKEQGAGDQGIMFGYACDETEELMPLPIHLAHRIVERLAEVRESGEIKWLRPDGKTQVTVEYEDDKAVRVHTIVLSAQHDAAVKYEVLSKELVKKVVRAAIPSKMLDDKVIYHINPTGRFVQGGPAADTGVTGRKIIVDTYGGRGHHGGGAFSGKDPTKVDRSASYMCRYIAKNIVAARIARRAEVQVGYAIGVAEPVSIMVDTEGTGKVDNGKLEKIIRDNFPLTPKAMIEYLNLRRPIYKETARHGHFGRTGINFTWERTDKADDLRKAAKL
jgi:S-adenosylmethionine synthetase